MIHLTVLGAPRTKKNHGRRVWAPRKQKVVHVPSEAYEAWESAAVLQLIGRHRAPDGPLNCRALIYREALTGDAVGYYQAIADMLQKAEVVANDKLVVSWDGTRLRKDAKNPRVEITLTPAED